LISLAQEDSIKLQQQCKAVVNKFCKNNYQPYGCNKQVITAEKSTIKICQQSTQKVR
jgi:acyl-ACP thioesterase